MRASKIPSSTISCDLCLVRFVFSDILKYRCQFFKRSKSISLRLIIPPHMASHTSAVAGRVTGETSDAGYFGQYQWDWLHEPTKVTKNKGGTTGWGKVFCSSNPDHPAGAVLRIHLCANNPCTARWRVSSYGLVGVPVHMQQITCMGPTASPLHPLVAAPPAQIPQSRAPEKNTAVAGATASDTSTVACQARVNAAVLHLAREIRRPRAYVGYSAFTLFGLCKRRRPRMWEGDSEIDLLALFAPWAITEDTRECAVAAIACALVGKAGGVIECKYISEEVPLSKTCHYFAGVNVQPQSRDEGDDTFESFYARLGISTLPTVCDGDCAFDAMNMMLGIPQSLETRTQLRVEISDYLLERAGERWMLELLVLAQELDREDVDRCCAYSTSAAGHSSDPEAVDGDTPAGAAAAAVDKADDAPAAIDDETFDAMRWASGLDHDASVVGLI